MRASMRERVDMHAVGNMFLSAMYTLLHDGNMLLVVNKSVLEYLY